MSQLKERFMPMQRTPVQHKRPSLKGKLEHGDVLLAVSPFYWMVAPLYGIHVLEAACKESGLTSRVLYSNLLYSNLTGIPLHNTLAVDHSLLIYEHLFSAAVFGEPVMRNCTGIYADPGWVPDHNWPGKKEPGTTYFPPPITAYREWFNGVDWQALESATLEWVEELGHEIAQYGFPVVGCSSSLGGLLPAIALLKSVKSAAPNTITVIGGAMCEAEMAGGIHSLHAGVDYVFSGEGEMTFPALVKQILEGHLPPETIIRGEEVLDLDTVPLPDYSEFFRQVKEFQPQRNTPGTLNFSIPFETSRGCWYHKCAFCDLSGSGASFRKKSPASVVDGLKALSKEYPGKTVYMTDSIMPAAYFKGVLPQLEKEKLPLDILYEMKANLSLKQVLQLKRAGIKEIQPGIEAFSTSLLKRMHKGVTLSENVALLRYSRSAGLGLSWNLLFGFPGDHHEEYRQLLELLPLLRHLQPPENLWAMRIRRFCRYHREPGTYGISNLRPAEVFEHIFPTGVDTGSLAYYFAGEFHSGSYETPELVRSLWGEFRAWRDAWGIFQTVPIDLFLPALHITRNPQTASPENQFLLEDRRGLEGNPERQLLSREQAALLLVSRPLTECPEEELRRFLDSGLAFAADSRLVPLATAPPELLLEFEEKQG